MTTTLSKAETTLLLDAAGRGGALKIPEATKPATRQRLIGRFEREGLIRPQEDGYVLTPHGYRAVGLRPPRQPKAQVGSDEAGHAAASSSGSPRPGTKLAMILDLLGREEGASIDELMSATGWLPHTTRAALSRIRSAGKRLVKSSRQDGRTAYRIEEAECAVEPGQPEGPATDSASLSATQPDRARSRRRKAEASETRAAA